MKKLFSFIIIIYCFQIKAQHNDNVWLIGYNYCNGCAKSALDFTYGHPDTVGIYSPLPMMATNSSICDSNGLLQFYTNGILVANKYGQLLSGSNGFNYDTSVTTFGWSVYMPYYQCAISVPFPGRVGQYCLFHLSGRDWNSSNFIQPCRMGYSIIDMNANGGAGEMISQNQTAIDDTLLYSTMQAVKHANGIDWWIVAHEFNSSGMYAALLTTDSIVSIVHSLTGPFIRKGISVGQSKFSPDGNKFAIASRDSSLLYLYRFNRCSGEFTFDTLIRHNYNSSGYNLASCAFSPNSRYLYASDHLKIYQYDTDVPDIPASEKVVGSNNGNAIYYFKLNNAPDGKIYISTWGSSQYLHVINDPDQPDTACHFVSQQQKIIYYSSSIPDFPNFQLNALPDSTCDSLMSNFETINNLSAELHVFPNPSSGKFTFDLTRNEKINELIITDLMGKRIPFKRRDNEIDLSDFPDGPYFFSIQTETGVVLSGSLLKIE